LTPTEFLVWVFVYTPVFQFLILYAWSYRHEPLRLFHPSMEKSDFKTWVDVLIQLGLVNGTAKVKGENALLKHVPKFLLPAVLISLACPALLLPAVLFYFPVLGRFSLPVLFLLQFIPAAYSLTYLGRNYLGPIPLPPRRSPISPRRQSSLIRHLGEKRAGGKPQRGSSVEPTPDSSPSLEALPRPKRLLDE
jgi:hypothetical protein